MIIYNEYWDEYQVYLSGVWVASFYYYLDAQRYLYRRYN